MVCLSVSNRFYERPRSDGSKKMVVKSCTRSLWPPCAHSCAHILVTTTASGPDDRAPYVNQSIKFTIRGQWLTKSSTVIMIDICSSEYKSFNAVLSDRNICRQHLHVPSHRKRASTACPTSCQHLFVRVSKHYKLYELHQSLTSDEILLFMSDTGRQVKNSYWQEKRTKSHVL